MAFALAGRSAAARRLQQHAGAGARRRRARRARRGRAAARASARGRSRIWRRPPATACSSPIDRSDITLRGAADPAAPGRLAEALPECHGHDRGPLRRARHARIQSGARRAPRAGGQERARRAAASRRRGSRRSAMARSARRCRIRTKSPMRRTAAASPPSTERRANVGRRGSAAQSRCGWPAAPFFCPKPALLAIGCPPTPRRRRAAASRPGSIAVHEAPQMFRQRSAVCLSDASALRRVAAATVAGAASGQDRSTQERLDRLERDLNMLQRQVYRGGRRRRSAATATRPSIPRSAWTARSPDARADRSGRGGHEPGRAAAPAGRADQQRYRGALQPGAGRTGTGCAAGAPPARPGRPRPMRQADRVRRTGAARRRRRRCRGR